MATIEKPATPDAAQKSHDASQTDAALRDYPRAGRRGYDPQIAAQMAAWDQ